MIQSVWQFRRFIVASIVGELRQRFVRSSLGALWFILHPLAQSLIFALVLSELMQARLPNVDNKAGFAIYLLSGMAAWSLFSEVLNRCIGIFVEYAGVMKKIAFPRLCLPIIVGGSALLNHYLLLAAIVIVFSFFSHQPGIAWIALPISMAIILLFAFGLGVMLGVLNVFVRDVSQVMIVVVQLWFWLTPIVYTADLIPASIMSWFKYINPMIPLVDAYQKVMLYNEFPNLMTLIPPFITALILVVFSFFTVKLATRDLIDQL